MSALAGGEGDAADGEGLAYASGRTEEQAEGMEAAFEGVWGV